MNEVLLTAAELIANSRDDLQAYYLNEALKRWSWDELFAAVTEYKATKGAN